MKLGLREVIRVVRGEVVAAAGGGDAVLSGVSIDSRRVAAGDLFLALHGRVHDGHDFVGEAFRAGAAAAQVTRPVEARAGVQVIVDDVLAAATALAAYVRDDVDPLVVGVTGSVGKTTTKDLIAAVAARRFRTVASERSHNNDLGVPLTLLAVEPDTGVVVCEMGARGPGHIAALCRYARPHVGVLTNVGVTHFSEFGSKEAIGEEKGQLIRALPEGGAAVLNADDPIVLRMRSHARGNVVTYGVSPAAYVRAEQVEFDRRGRAGFRVVAGAEAAWVSLRVSGRHQVANALAAAATGVALGIPLDECARGLDEAKLSPWRMDVRESGGVVVVNDAYNASPASMAAALETCAGMVADAGNGAPGGRLVAVLGYMAELGEIEQTEHERVGALAAALADELVVVGENARGIADGARRAGLGAVRLVPDAAEVPGLVEARPGDVVLVKASRVAGLETVAETLQGGPTAEDVEEETAEGLDADAGGEGEL